MKKIIILIFAFSITGILSANDNLLLLEEANKSYTEDNFEKAIELYEKVIDNGSESAAVYFNLGNAWFKMNNMPEAILYYEKARKLTPYDADILFNLQVANSRIVDKIESVPEIFYVRWWKNLLYFFSVDQWAAISLSAFGLLMLMLLFFMLSNWYWLRKTAFWMGIIFLLIAGASYSLANQKHQSFIKEHQAIVFTPTLTVKSSPSETGIDVFVIHEGSKVQITDHIGDWLEVEIANGSVGWIKEEDVKKI